MTNAYFNHPTSPSRFVRGTLARADDINARLDEVSAGFDLVNVDVDDANAAAVAAAASAAAALVTQTEIEDFVADKEVSIAATIAAGEASVEASVAQALEYAQFASDTATAAAAFKGAWSSLTGPLSKPASVSHLGQVWLLLNNLADVTASQPSSGNADWQTMRFEPEWSVKTANYTAVGGEYLHCDTSAGSFTITLPASPIVGDKVHVVDLAGTFGVNALVIARNGSKIMQLTENLLVDVPYASVALTYSNATYGWILT